MAQALTQLGRLGGVVAVGAYILPHIIYDGICFIDFLNLCDFCMTFNMLDQNRTLDVKESLRYACHFAF